MRQMGAAVSRLCPSTAIRIRRSPRCGRSRRFIAGMALSDEETRTLIDYAHRRGAMAMSPALRPVREDHGQARSETGASAIAGARKPCRAELAVGEEAAPAALAG